MKTTFVSHSEEETMNLAKKIAANSKVGDIIVLSGDLGSGKTKFTEGFLSFFNMQDEISSPTFTIVNEYNSKDVNLYHFDVYRLLDISEFYEIGGDEYFTKGICIIEWGELIKEALPPDYLEISFSRKDNDENSRTLTLESHGDYNLCLE